MERMLKKRVEEIFGRVIRETTRAAGKSEMKTDRKIFWAVLFLTLKENSILEMSEKGLHCLHYTN